MNRVVAATALTFVTAEELADAMPDGMAVLESRDRILFANPKLVEMSGYAATELIGRSIRLLVPDADDPRSREPHSGPHHSHTTGLDLGILGHRKDGSHFHAEITFSPIPIPEAGYVIAVVRDVTRRLETDERFRNMIEQVDTHAIFALDPNGYIQTWNAGAERLKGYSADEAIGRPASIFYTETDLKNDVPARLLREAARTGTVHHIGWRVRKDGSQFQASVTITALRSATGDLSGFVKITRDITQALRDRDDAERMHLLEERERLARDLHDGAIQDIFAVGMSLQSLMSAITDRRVADRVAESVEHLDSVILDLRSYIFDLRRISSVDALRAALERIESDFADRSQIQLTSSIDRAALQILVQHPEDVLLFLKEALSNVARHSSARSCAVRIASEGGSAIIEVLDDGAGFDTSRPSHGLGLTNAKTRAVAIGADYSVSSGRAGTAVRLRIVEPGSEWHPAAPDAADPADPGSVAAESNAASLSQPGA